MEKTRDSLSIAERSERMSRVRSTGNKSTEAAVAQMLIEANLNDWVIQPKGIEGKPDFFFPAYRLIIFVDGCFWHACPICKRRLPANHAEFWTTKIEANRLRDDRVRRRLRRDRYHVMRVWEHEIRHGHWVSRLEVMIQKCRNKANDGLYDKLT